MTHALNSRTRAMRRVGGTPRESLGTPATQHPASARLETFERALYFRAAILNCLFSGTKDPNRLTDDHRGAAERLRHARSIPALRSPAPIDLYVNSKNGLPGRARQKGCARLRDARRAARAVNGKPNRPAGGEIAAHLHQSPGATPRCRTTGSPEAKTTDDSGNPLAVKILAGDNDDIAVAKVVGRKEYATVPDSQNRLLTAGDHGIVVFLTFGGPGQRPAEGPDERRRRRGDDAGLGTLKRSEFEVGHGGREILPL